MVGLLETRVKPHNFAKISKKINGYGFIIMLTHSARGRIGVGYHPNVVDVNVIETHEQFIHLWISTKAQDWASMVTFVYGLHTVETRKALWLKLTSLAWLGSSW